MWTFCGDACAVCAVCCVRCAVRRVYGDLAVFDGVEEVLCEDFGLLGREQEAVPSRWWNVGVCRLRRVSTTVCLW